MRKYCLIVFLSLLSQSIFSQVHDIKQFLEKCPTEDPVINKILHDFHIYRNGERITSFNCSEPISNMNEQIDLTLIYLQSFRTIYYMDRHMKDHLPWTDTTMYAWMKDLVGGIDIRDDVIGGGCCGNLNERYIINASAYPGTNFTVSDIQWQRLSRKIGLLCHEARHRDSKYHHTSCCGINNGCDQTYNESNLGSYGIQYWLVKSWLNGNINVGVNESYISAEIQNMIDIFLSDLNNFRERTCDNRPDVLTKNDFDNPFGNSWDKYDYLTCIEEFYFDDPSPELIEAETKLTVSTNKQQITLEQLRTAGGDAYAKNGIATISYQDEFVEDFSCVFLKRTFEMVDQNDKSIKTVQNIIVNDDSSPVIICPNDTIIYSDYIDTISGLGYTETFKQISLDEFRAYGGNVSENCSISKIKYVDLQKTGYCNLHFRRKFEVTDINGNSSECSQYIRFDNGKNELYAPGRLEFCSIQEAEATTLLPLNPEYTEISIEKFLELGGRIDSTCGVDIHKISYKDIYNPNYPNFTRIFKINDSEGYEFVSSQAIVLDRISPEIQCPADTTVDFIGLTPKSPSVSGFIDNGGGIYDDCGIDSMSFRIISETIDSINLPNSMLLTYAIDDNMGNESVCTQKVSYNKPTFGWDVHRTNELTIEIFPSPNDGVFDLKIENLKGQKCLVQISSLKGQLILEQEMLVNGRSINQSIDVSGHTKGAYVVTILNEQNKQSKKFILH